MKNIVIMFILCSVSIICKSQSLDSTQTLKAVTITSYRTINGIGRMQDEDGKIIYAGKKNEILLIDSLDANKSMNNTRQIIGRIPGLNIIETESGGFTANGIGFRGLNPSQSIETNTRQNGYNISADVFGYNESYYLPPMEAVKDITFLHGASAIAFGPQIGGMINYEIKDGGTKPIEVTESQTIGSYNMFNSFTSIGGTYKKITYYAFLQYRTFAGWRVNSEQSQLSDFACIKYNPSDKIQIGIEYTGLRNRIKMPGGLTDSLFKTDPRQSFRNRNWLQSPWNIISANFRYKFNDRTILNFQTSFLYSQRDLVWKDEAGGPGVKDSITPELTYVPREVEHEYFRSITNELRFITSYKLGKQKQILSFGVRYSYSFMNREEDAEGTRGSDMDFTTISTSGDNMEFFNTNLAPFVENTFRIGDRFSITPGIRIEYLRTSTEGADEEEGNIVIIDEGDSDNDEGMLQHTRTFLVGGLGLQYKASETTNIYANYSQSYKPISYSELTPFGTIARIDKKLKDPKADNIDFGYRGSVGNVMNFDIGLFYINYKNRIGTIYKMDTAVYAFRTNTGNSEHKGIESYLEINILDGLIRAAQYGKLSIYNSYSYIDARYIKGDYTGKYVEYAPKNIERVGINYRLNNFSINVQYSYTGSSFGDASNAKYAADALTGNLPSYNLVDISASYKLKQKIQFKLGINNLTDEKYFTLRTTEYPGPGIIPSIRRTLYAGITLTI